MKQIMAVLIVVSIFSISMVALATDLEFGTQGTWQLTDQLDLGLMLGLYRQISDRGEAHLAGFGRGDLCYTLEKSSPSVQFVLDGEMRGSEYKRLYGGYITPLTSKANLQIGLAFERKQSANPVSLVLKSVWQVGPGNLKMELQEGANGLVQAQYRVEQCFQDKISLAAESGIRYTWEDVGGGWEVPVELSARLQLKDHLYFKVQAANTFTVGEDEQKKPLTVGFYLQRDFDWRKNPKKTHVTAQPIQIPANLETELVETSVEVVISTETEPAEESVPVEEIALVHVKEVEENEPLKMSEIVEENNTEREIEKETPVPPMFYYEAESRTVFFKGQLVKVEPFIEDRQIVFPLRDIFESLGGAVYWYDDPRQICLVLDQQKVYLDLEGGTCQTNGREIALEGSLQLLNDHFYVGIEDLMQLLGVVSEETIDKEDER